MTNKPSYDELERKIHEMKVVEAELRQSEKKYQKLLETLNEAVYHMSLPDGTYEYVSPSIQKVFGYTDEQLYANPLLIQKIIHPDFHTYFQEKWMSLLEGIVPPTYKYKITDPDASERWIIQSNVGIFDEKGRISGIQGIIRDITERVKTEEELKEYRQHLEKLVEKRTAELESKNKELETFTYSVSHDLKAPLRGIDGYSRLLTENYAEQLDEEGLQFLSNVRQSAEQMNQLIEDLLTYSRMERRSIHNAAINLKALIELLISERQHDIESGQIQIDLKIPIESIHADSDTLKQVIGNYIDNAIKFAHKEKQPVVEVGGNESGDKWTVWVKDNGIGFEPEYHDRIFQIFQRLHRLEDYPGTGVGLAIARKAVERMGGRVWAESTLGEGAIFYVEIPKVA